MKKIWKSVLLLIMIYTFSSFAFVVSDNDGEAFITKKEFEALKKKYKSIVDTYNNSLDSKIDGAIAEYISQMVISRTESFDFDVYSERCAVCNSDKVSNLKYSKAGIDWVLTHTNIETVTDGMVTSAVIEMRRDATPGYELFKLASDDVSFDYYDNNAKIETSATSNFSSFTNAHNSPEFNQSDNILTVRWHSGPWDKFEKVRDPELDANRQYEGYDDRFSKPSFFSYYGSYFHGGNSWPCSEVDDKARTSIVSSIVVIPDAPAYLLMDNNETQINNTKIWIKDPSLHNDVVVASAMPLYDSTNQIFDTPTDAGVVTTGFAILQRKRNFQGSGITEDRYYDGTNVYKNIIWVTSGDFQSASGDALHTDTAGEWSEFHLESTELNQNEIKNAYISDSIINKYASYGGYRGYITEGFPIGIFNRQGEITFEIDTSCFINGCYFGVSTQPFNNETNKLSDLSKVDENIILYVDDVKKDYCRDVLSSGKHKIRLKYESDDKNAIYYKIGIKDEDDKTKCFVFNMPSKYIYTY